MSRTRVRNGSALGAALAALLIVVAAMYPSLIPFLDDSPAGGSTTDCADKVHFYAGDVPADTNFYGPAATGTVDELRVEQHNRRCVDPALTVGDAHVNKLEGFKDLTGDTQFASKIRELRDNPELWLDTIEALEKKEATATKVSKEQMSGKYETLYQLYGVTDVPLIRKDEPNRPSFEVLRYKYADGSEVNYKLDCGFQPVAPKFPNVPPVDTPPPPDQPPPTVTTTTQPTTPTTRPTTTTRDSGKKNPGTTVPAPPITVAPPRTTTTLDGETSPPGGNTGSTIPPQPEPPAEPATTTTEPGGGFEPS